MLEGIIHFLFQILVNLVSFALSCLIGERKFKRMAKKMADQHSTGAGVLNRMLSDVPKTVIYRDAVDANWKTLLASTSTEAHYVETSKVRRRPPRKDLSAMDDEMQEDAVFKMPAIPKKRFGKNNNQVDPHPQLIIPKPITQLKERPKTILTKFIALDCEMVGIGRDGVESMLARVALVNKFGECIYDKFVKPTEKVTDYRTSVSGIRPNDIVNAPDYMSVIAEVANLIKGKVIVGHSLSHDLKLLRLSLNKRFIRDTSRYPPFRKIVNGSTPSLKRLAKEILGVDIQQGEHSPVEDARVAMLLYKHVSAKWEASFVGRHGKKSSKSTSSQ